MLILLCWFLWHEASELWYCCPYCHSSIVFHRSDAWDFFYQLLAQGFSSKRPWYLLQRKGSFKNTPFIGYSPQEHCVYFLYKRSCCIMKYSKIITLLQLLIRIVSISIASVTDLKRNPQTDKKTLWYIDMTRANVCKNGAVWGDPDSLNDGFFLFSLMWKYSIGKTFPRILRSNFS